MKLNRCQAQKVLGWLTRQTKHFREGSIDFPYVLENKYPTARTYISFEVMLEAKELKELTEICNNGD